MDNVFGFPPGYRLEIENGYLQIILKTGIIGLLLMVIIAIRALYLGVFRSKNTFTVICALIVLERYMAMNFGGLPEYSMNYILYWICVGGCLSERIRNLSNVEIFFLLKGGKYYSPIFKTRSNVPELAASQKT
jgi:O-antigen ligase